MAVPPCDLENLADAIKMIMGECEKAGLFCGLQEGTLLSKIMTINVLKLVKNWSVCDEILP